jgi:hypothetical protein
MVSSKDLTDVQAEEGVESRDHKANEEGKKWAELMKSVFTEDVCVCRNCGGGGCNYGQC